MFEIGNSLREARLRQGLDFPEIEQRTKIRGKYLRALEEEQFDLLPGQTYVKGFLRSYAEYLGLDGQLYVDEFNSRYVTGEEEPPIRPRRAEPSFGRRGRTGESRGIMLALAGIAAVIFAFYTNSVSPSSHGNFFELYGIAAAVLGGCSLRGGEGSVVGILLGTALLQVLQNLVNLLGIPSSLNFAVMGAVILIGVLADQLLKRKKGKA